VTFTLIDFFCGNRERVRRLGNPVTPPVAEILIAALVEAVTGEHIELAA
jgi:DNA (cytosine-5)-methyltransferase 1